MKGSVCYVFFPLAPLSLPLHTHRTPLAVLPRPPSLLGHPAALVPPLFSLFWHSWTPHSLDLWIFPGSPLDLPFFPWTPISGCFFASSLLLLLFHLRLCTPTSQSLCAPILYFYLWSPVSPLTSFHIDSSSLCHHLLSYSLNSTMTHSPWLIASPTSYINP